MKLHISRSLALPADLVTSTIVVYGGKGMGKTNLGAVIVEELAKLRAHFAVLDPLGVWWGLRHSRDGKGAGIECLILGGAHGDIPIEPTAGAICADLVVEENANVIIDFSRAPSGKVWSVGEKIRFVTDYATHLFERQGELVGGKRRAPMFQLLDEAARYIPQTFPSGAIDVARCVGAWNQIVEEGRNFGLGVGLITQRSARMAKSVSELADAMIAFRTIGPNSINAITDWLGEHVPKERWKDYVEELRRLPRGSALVVSPGWLEFEGVVPMRMRETFDSSATPSGESRNEPRGGAKPDLEKYRTRMAETIERAKLDDPKALRTQVAELKKQLAAKAKPAAAASDESVIARAVEKASRFERNRAETIVRVQSHFWETVEVQLRILDDLHRRATSALDDVRDDNLASVPVVAGGSPADGKSRPQSSTLIRRVAAPSPEGRRHQPAELSKGERIVLTAIAQYPDGVARNDLTTLTGYKRSTRDTYIQRLVAAGYVSSAGGALLLATMEGVAALGDFEPLPTGDALYQWWLPRLSEGERRVLQFLHGISDLASRDDISEATGYKRSTRDTYLQRLRTRRLIETNSAGGVRASRDLFD